MIEPSPGYAPLTPGLIGLPRDAGFGLIDDQSADEYVQAEPRWREDLRFFLVCYFTAFCAFLFLLG